MSDEIPITPIDREALAIMVADTAAREENLRQNMELEILRKSNFDSMHRMELIRLATETLTANNLGKPIKDRIITAEDITAYAEHLRTYVQP